MLKRKITQDLIEWKNRAKRKPLVIKGARQVGKTFIVEQFIRAHYDNCVALNFVEHPEYGEIFANDLSARTIVKQISLLVSGVDLGAPNAVLFLDEIQQCPNAITALKFLSIEADFDVIATGSLLGISYKEVSSFPVGYIDNIEMSSLDFEEFLWAMGISAGSIADIKAYFDSVHAVPQAMHTRMFELFKEYVAIGGMPEVVQNFAENNNFADALRLQRAIVSGYLDDVAKYAEGVEKNKVRECLLSLPKQLAKDYKKFQYSVVESGGTGRKFGGSLMWLKDAGIVDFCYNLTRPGLPFEGYAQSDNFKVYMRDTGLLISMLDDGAQADIIRGNFGIYKGAVYENIIAEIFAKTGKKLQDAGDGSAWQDAGDGSACPALWALCGWHGGAAPRFRFTFPLSHQSGKVRRIVSIYSYFCSAPRMFPVIHSFRNQSNKKSVPRYSTLLFLQSVAMASSERKIANGCTY